MYKMLCVWVDNYIIYTYYTSFGTRLHGWRKSLHIERYDLYTAHVSSVTRPPAGFVRYIIILYDCMTTYGLCVQWNLSKMVTV